MRASTLLGYYLGLCDGIRVLQRCISEEEGRNLLAEIHARLGGHHAAARALVGKAFRTGFYWPTAGQMLRT